VVLLQSAVYGSVYNIIIACFDHIINVSLHESTHSQHSRSIYAVSN